MNVNSKEQADPSSVGRKKAGRFVISEAKSEAESPPPIPPPANIRVQIESPRVAHTNSNSSTNESLDPNASRISKKGRFVVREQHRSPNKTQEVTNNEQKDSN